MEITYQLNEETNMVEKVISGITEPIDTVVLAQEKKDNLTAISRYKALITGLESRNGQIDSDIAMDAEIRDE